MQRHLHEVVQDISLVPLTSGDFHAATRWRDSGGLMRRFAERLQPK